MFKNAIIYRMQLPEGASLQGLTEALAASPFLECAPTQEISTGWVPPREEHGAMVEAIGGHWIFRLQSEAKAVPGSVLTRKTKEKAKLIFEQTGRKPGKKELKEIKEELKLTLLPMAFSKIGAVTAWFDPAAGLLVLDTASITVADHVITHLVRAVDGLKLALVDTKTSPTAAMADWLTTQEPPAGFSLGQSCELKACDESKAKVRYDRHSIETDEVRQHIAQGKLPTKLELTWEDRITFVLTEGGHLSKIEFDDVVFEGQRAVDAGNFDADVAIMTIDLSELIDALIEALGGEAVAQEGAPA